MVNNEVLLAFDVLIFRVGKKCCYTKNVIFFETAETLRLLFPTTFSSNKGLFIYFCYLFNYEVSTENQVVPKS